MTAPLHVSSSALDRRAAARDLWPGGTLRMWMGEPPVLPDRVAWPEDEAQVAEAFAEAARAGQVVVPYGAGSGVCGGARGGPGALVVDTKRLQGIGRVDARWIVEVGAGVNGQHLEDELARQGFTCGHSPSSIGCSTVGGWAAARSAGQLSSRYGVFEDMVVGLDAVAPGIGPFHVGLPGAASPARRGPAEWLPLLLGSEGTLAVITRVRLRVRPLPERRWLRGWHMPDVRTALDVMRRLMQAELWPAAVRLYDPLDTLIGGKTRPSHEAHGGGAWWRSWLAAVDDLPGVRARTLVLPLSLPGLVRRVAEGLTDGCLLVVGFEGAADVVEASARAAAPMLDAVGRDLGPGPGERWYAARHNVSYKLMPVFERGGFADTMEVAAPWSVLPGLYEAVREAVGRDAIVMAHMSHCYPEGGCIYFSFAGRGDVATYERVWAQALDAVAASGGTVTHHHGVGRLKARAATREVGAARVGWSELKRELDPEGRMNPGVVYEAEEVLGAVPVERLTPADGLRRVAATAAFEALPRDGGEPLWGWERLPEPERMAREPYQTGWIEVRGAVGGHPVAVGRGPRSAVGPDLRGEVVRRDGDATATIAWTEGQPCWMGEGRPPRPWATARALLRADLRPAVLAVRDGALRVGFRGPAAADFGALAHGRVEGGLVEVPWQLQARASGPLEPCEDDDPRAVGVTCETAWRRVEAHVATTTSEGVVQPELVVAARRPARSRKRKEGTA